MTRSQAIAKLTELIRSIRSVGPDALEKDLQYLDEAVASHILAVLDGALILEPEIAEFSGVAHAVGDLKLGNS